jgi:hypothetical protein
MKDESRKKKLATEAQRKNKKISVTQQLITQQAVV